MKILKTTLKMILIAIVTLILILVIYLLYVIFQYSRIEDNLDITSDIVNNSEVESVSTDNIYTIATYNIGFGAYTRDFTFFMDSGVMKDGTKVVGTMSTAKTKDTVLTNTTGAIDLVNKYNPDFMFFQEVDTDATRSHHINQYEMIQSSFSKYDTIIGMNFHSAYLAYPLYDNHGKTNAGIVTLSKYQIYNSVRMSLPIDSSFPTRFFDLDRCFTISQVKISNSDKSLVLINVHLSAYDEGGTIRKQQLEILKNILEQEKNNYVIVGGDFNHDIAESDGIFESNQLRPDWVQIFPNNELTSGYLFATSINGPTCRSTDLPYVKGINYTVVIDGFIISNNISVESVTNIITNGEEDVSFLYSDHNPVVMKFKLNN